MRENMAYQALYRKWRPLEFEDVKGQEHIVTTLKESKEDIKNKILNQKYTQHIDSLYKNGKITIT